MSEKRYVIEMRTPLGIRHGTLKASIMQDRIRGCLELMNHSEPFSGSIDGEGNCEFTGKIITLMRTISYKAAGTIKENKITLTLQGERNTFQITGTADQEESRQKEERSHGKVLWRRH